MYATTYIMDIAALLFLIILLYSSTSLNIDRKKPFLFAIILTIIVILSEAGTILSSTEILNHRNLNILFNVLGFSLAPLIPISIIFIYDRMILEKYRLLLIPTIINMVVTIMSPIHKFIFYVNVNNHYARGDYFFIFVIVYIVNLILLIYTTLEFSKKNNYPIIGKIAALAIFTITGTSIQLLFPRIYSSWHCVTLSLMLYFLLMSEHDSSFDTLTSFYNRAAFDKAVKHMGGIKPFSIIVLDINDFKLVNDTYGHVYGDNVIKIIAAIIRKSFDKRYTCYRLGGDEFSIIGRETDDKKIEDMLRNMADNLAEIEMEGNPLPTLSYGYSFFSGGEELDFEKILNDADSQMYQYKRIHKSISEKKDIGLNKK